MDLNRHNQRDIFDSAAQYQDEQGRVCIEVDPQRFNWNDGDLGGAVDALAPSRSRINQAVMIDGKIYALIAAQGTGLG